MRFTAPNLLSMGPSSFKALQAGLTIVELHHGSGGGGGQHLATHLFRQAAPLDLVQGPIPAGACVEIVAAGNWRVFLQVPHAAYSFHVAAIMSLDVGPVVGIQDPLGAIELLGFDTSQLLMAATPCPLFQGPGVFPGIQLLEAIKAASLVFDGAAPGALCHTPGFSLTQVAVVGGWQLLMHATTNTSMLATPAQPRFFPCAHLSFIGRLAMEDGCIATGTLSLAVSAGLGTGLEHGNVSEIALDFVILHRVEALSLVQ